MTVAQREKKIQLTARDRKERTGGYAAVAGVIAALVRVVLGGRVFVAGARLRVSLSIW